MEGPISTTSLLKGSNNNELWQAIQAGRIEAALQLLGGAPADKTRRWFSFGKKEPPAPVVGPVQQLARDLLSGKITDLVAPTTTLTKAGDLFPEWVRFLWVLQDNGHYHAPMTSGLQATIPWLEQLAAEVSEKADGYPQKSIAAYIWRNGAILRKWCDPVAGLFQQQGKPQDRAKILQLKCQLTGAIMSHYPQTLGPDMIAAAAAWESVGETAIPQRYYQAIITDFQPLAEDIRAMAAEGVTEDGIQILQALRDAYDGWNRIQQAPAFAVERAWVETLLQKGVTASVEDEDD